MKCGYAVCYYVLRSKTYVVTAHSIASLYNYVLRLMNKLLSTSK